MLLKLKQCINSAQNCFAAELFLRDMKYGADEITMPILKSSHIFQYCTNYKWLCRYKFNCILFSVFFLLFQSDTNITPSLLLWHAGKNKIYHNFNQVDSNSVENNIGWGFCSSWSWRCITGQSVSDVSKKVWLIS